MIIHTEGPNFESDILSTVNRQPSTVNRQPSTVNRQPSTVNRQPSTVNLQKSSRISNYLFLTALGLISLIAYTLFFCALSMIRGYPVSYWQFPLAAAFMLVTQFFAARYFFEKKAVSAFFRSGILLLGIALFSLFAANSIYDTSFDGQWYHQEMISQIKNGFNPYLKILPAPEDEPVPDSKDVWCSGPVQPAKDTAGLNAASVNLVYLDINHFAKGIEIVEAAIYRLTGRIETGKAVNLMALIASFCLCLSFLYKLNPVSTAKKWIIAVLASFNPITIAQLTTYCVDGVMISVFLCLFVLFGLIMMEQNQNYLYLLGLLVMVGVNIKFTSLVYTALFCAGFLAILFVGKKRLQCKRVFYACLISALLGVFFIGFHPYLTNLISTNQVFYGLPETRGEIYDITPSLFRDKNRFEKLFISLATQSDDQAAEKESVAKTLKLPFSINKQELLNANHPELKLAGFGPFFSGAVLLSIILLLLITRSAAKTLVFKNGLAATGIILLSVFIIPDSWWARFVPQLWLVPVIILLLSEFLPASRGRILRPLLYAAIGLNVVWASLGIFYNISISSHIQYQLTQLKALSLPITVEYCPYRPFKSNHLRLDENNIRYAEGKTEGKYIYNIIHSNTKFATTERLPDLPKPWLMRLNEKIKAGNRE